MYLDVWATFVGACVIFSISPGASMVATISNSITGGIRIAMKNIIGLQLALMTHLLIVSIGLGALLSTSALAFTILKYLGAAYLFYLGVTKFFCKDRVIINNECEFSDLKSDKAIIWQGFIVNMMNPKSIIFLAAFLPQFLNPIEAQFHQYMLLGITVLIVDLAVMFSYAALANSIRPYLLKSRFSEIQNKLFGSLYMAMGAVLARSER